MSYVYGNKYLSFIPDISKCALIGNSKDLYLLDQDINKLYKVNTERGLVEEIGSISLEHRGISSVIISKDKIYVLSGQVGDDKIIVYDINSMKELYQGKIEAKNGIEMNGGVELSLKK